MILQMMTQPLYNGECNAISFFSLFVAFFDSCVIFRYSIPIFLCAGSDGKQLDSASQHPLALKVRKERLVQLPPPGTLA